MIRTYWPLAAMGCAALAALVALIVGRRLDRLDEERAAEANAYLDGPDDDGLWPWAMEGGW